MATIYENFDAQALGLSTGTGVLSYTAVSGGPFSIATQSGTDKALLFSYSPAGNLFGNFNILAGQTDASGITFNLAGTAGTTVVVAGRNAGNAVSSTVVNFTTTGIDQNVSLPGIMDSFVISGGIPRNTVSTLQLDDFVANTAAVPEPASASVLLVGALALGALVRRKRNAPSADIA